MPHSFYEKHDKTSPILDHSADRAFTEHTFRSYLRHMTADFLGKVTQ
jgi:hypothetical protein